MLHPDLSRKLPKQGRNSVLILRNQKEYDETDNELQSAQMSRRQQRRKRQQEKILEKREFNRRTNPLDDFQFEKEDVLDDLIQRKKLDYSIMI